MILLGDFYEKKKEYVPCFLNLIGTDESSSFEGEYRSSYKDPRFRRLIDWLYIVVERS